MRFLLNILLNAVSQVMIVLLYGYLCFTYFIDYDRPFAISNFFDVKIKVAAERDVDYYFSPVNKNDLYFYPASTGNRWFKELIPVRDSLNLTSIYYAGTYLAKKSKATTVYYSLMRNEENSNYFLKEVKSKVTLKEFIIYQILKSFLLFMGLTIFLVVSGFVFHYKTRRYLIASVFVSVSVSVYVVYIFFYGYFYQALLIHGL